MSGIFKVFLLLAAVVCFSQAQLNESGQQCLCQRIRKGIAMKSAVKDIQIYPATIFCEKVEIVVTENSGLRYCLDPQMSAVKKLLTKILRKQKRTAVVPPEATTKPSSTNTARI